MSRMSIKTVIMLNLGRLIFFTPGLRPAAVTARCIPPPERSSNHLRSKSSIWRVCKAPRRGTAPLKVGVSHIWAKADKFLLPLDFLNVRYKAVSPPIMVKSKVSCLRSGLNGALNSGESLQLIKAPLVKANKDIFKLALSFLLPLSSPIEKSEGEVLGEIKQPIISREE